MNLTFTPTKDYLKILYTAFSTLPNGVSYPAPVEAYIDNILISDGHEKSISSASGMYTTYFRQYDARLGKFLSLDPKPNSSISRYAAFANNPIFYSDPLGDTVKTNQEGFDVIKEGMDAALFGGGDSPFGYSVKKEQVTFNNNFDKTKFSPKQLALIDEFAEVVTGIETTDFNVVGFDEVLEDAGHLSGLSLSDKGLNGYTTPNGKKVFVAKYPMKPGMVQNPKYTGMKGSSEPFSIPGYVNTELYYRGLNAIHEIAGHVRLKFGKTILSQTDQFDIIEEMETRVRQHYKIGIHTKKSARKDRRKTGRNTQEGDVNFLEGKASRHLKVL